MSAAQMREVDRAAGADLGVPGVVLMENAGRGVADVVARARPALAGLRVAVACGAGSNGGDGFVAARHLANRGARVRILLAARPDKITGDARVFLAILEALNDIPIEDLSAVTQASAWSAALADADVIVDALLGTGLRDEVRGVASAAIASINAAPALRVSVDVPSGLDSDSGRPHGVSVRADITATMGCRKLGLAIAPGAPGGSVEVVDLGIPIRPPSGLGPVCYWLEREWVLAQLPRRAPAAHKGTAGHLLLVAGSPGKTGAAVLAARAALRAGAGLVTVASTRAGQASLDAKLLEAMTASYAAGDDADASSREVLERIAAPMKVVAIGPGIPTGPGMRELVRQLAGELPLPMVLDADALNLLARDAASTLRRAPAPRILTPHPGEMARLIGCGVAEVQDDRLGSARALAHDSGAVVLLKGARTVIAAPDGEAWINPAVNPALATAGSGDVLTGIVGALCAQGMGAAPAAACAAFLHGLAGALAAERLGGGGVLAGDLPDALAAVMGPGR